MDRTDRLTTLYIDFDAFFANVEKQLDPGLHDRPVGVSPLPSEYSCLIACCYDAKRAGIRRGMRVHEARDHLPDLAILPARHDVYVRQHHAILEVVERFAPVTKVWSIDEVECAPGALDLNDALDLAERLRTGLADACGRFITLSIGLSSNSLLGKIAAEMEKPRGLVALRPGDLPGRLFDVPLKNVPGIGGRMLRRLERAGISTMEHLWALEPKQARALWGSVEGERLVLQLHGRKTERPHTRRHMFGHSRVLTAEWKTLEKAGECLRLLTARAASRMRRSGFLATRLTVYVKDQTKRKIHVERQFAPACDDRSLHHLAQDAYANCKQRVATARLRHIGVMLHGLEHASERSADLFTDRTSAAQQQRNEAVSTAMDRLNARFGGDIIQLGFVKQPPGGYAGAKIAFGRIPDFEDFSRRPDG